MVAGSGLLIQSGNVTTMRGFDGGEQVAESATDLQYALTGANEEAIHFGEAVVVRSAPTAP